MKTKSLVTFIFAFVLSLGWSLAWAENLLITPLGQFTGEFCRADRALLFQFLAVPNGGDSIRILYDPGRTVAGGTDSRLGDVDVILLSSVHSDHIGVGKLDLSPDEPPEGEDDTRTCSGNPPLADTPNSNLAEIAAAKGSRVIVGGQMRDFLRVKVEAEGGLRSQVDILRHGGKRILGDGGANASDGGLVSIAVVRADHSNGIPTSLVSESHLGDKLEEEGLTAYAGPENGYVLTFTDGPVVYLSGDTGHTSDMATIVRGYYGANVAVVNMGDIFSMGPEEAAFAVTTLLQPGLATAIPSHANQASTSGGGVVIGTSRVQTFITEVGVGPPAAIVVPTSGDPITCTPAGVCSN